MMKKSLAILLAAVTAAAMITGCAASGKAPAQQAQAEAAAEEEVKEEAAEAETAETAEAAEAETTEAADAETVEEPAAAERMSYMSGDGWVISYDPELIASEEIDDHTAQFVYLGESAGTNMVIVSWEENVMPEELLYEVTSNWGDPETIQRHEGIFPGTDDKWGYWRILAPAEEGSGLGETAIAGEYKGGTLMFEVVNHFGEDEEQNMAVGDTLADVIDSITYKDGFGDQTMYSYFPGTYVSDTEDGHTEVVLNEDHTGQLRFQDDIDILWGSIELIAADGSFRYEYTIEGDNLMVNYDGMWLEFARAE